MKPRLDKPEGSQTMFSNISFDAWGDEALVQYNHTEPVLALSYCYSDGTKRTQQNSPIFIAVKFKIDGVILERVSQPIENLLVAHSY